ncbi:MAG: hypothetical protein JNM27_02925 [Leptospirales bacterium]|nr:hypothetical protein [Leptospirales bacterium]
MLTLTDEEIKALLAHPWEIDYKNLDSQSFWQNVLDYIPAGLASEVRSRLNPVLGETAASFQVRIAQT